jgi:predicted ATPase/DNA-binding CsgD family transcriptional regulator
MPLVQARRRRGQLPEQLTDFVGRKDELALLTELLHGTAGPGDGKSPDGRDNPRLVTVTGPGGVGKTRLAVHAVARAARWYPSGVHFADLSALSAPQLLPALAGGLGLSVAGPGDGSGACLPALLEHLRDRRLLLVLDTCEHLIEEAAHVTASLLRGAGEVTVLATSRQPLDLPGEHILPLRPLPVPGQDAREFGGTAVELFAARAANVIPGFTLTRDLLPEAIALCQRLDGIPLAIELAALRLRAFPLTAMGRLASQRDGSTRMLTGVRRTAVLRHQSLPKSIEWSRELCGQAERTAWARVSVFADGFGLAAAEAVCADEGLPPAQVTRAIIGLTDKSVLLRDPPQAPAGPAGLLGPGGPAGPAGVTSSRYRLPGALREAGADLLAATADSGAAVRARYLAHWARAAEQFASHILDDQLSQYQALRREHANLRGALEYALTLPAADSRAVTLGSALCMYWVISGDLREGRDWLDRIAGRHPDPGPERARVLAARAFLAAMADDLPVARADADASIALAARAGDRAALAQGYVALHRVQCSAGDIAAATATQALAIPALEQAGDMLGLAHLDIQSGLARVMTDPRGCTEICSRAAGRLPPGELWATSTLLGLVAVARLRAGEHAAASEPAREALAMRHRLGDAAGTGDGLRVLGLLAGAERRHERAAVLLGAADSLGEHARHRRPGSPWLAELHREAAQAALDALGNARYTWLRDAGAGQPPDQVIALALGTLSEPGPSPPPGTGTAPSAARPPAAPQVPAPAGSPLTGPLTSREVEIATLVADGLSNKEIAQRAAISKRTVDAHVDHIFAKLGLSSRVQLTVWLRDRIPRHAEPARGRAR